MAKAGRGKLNWPKNKSVTFSSLSYLPDSNTPVELSLPNISNDWQMTFDLPGMGGVFEPKNLSVYSYAHLNPLKYNDPDGNEAARPNYSQLAAQFPNPRTVSRDALFDSIGGMVARNGAIPPGQPGHWGNTCASRVSCSLNRGGQAIEPSLVPRDQNGRPQWSTGGDGNKYIFRVEALTDYLTNKYGAPDQVLSGDGKSLGDLEGKGILIFDMRGVASNEGYTGHATLYGGNGQTIDRSDYSDSSSRILFWKLPDGDN